jgi:hypothetical protein
MIAPAGIAAAVLTETLTKCRTRPVSKGVRADTHDAQALSAVVTNFPGLGVSCPPASSPLVLKFAEPVRRIAPSIYPSDAGSSGVRS